MPVLYLSAHRPKPQRVICIHLFNAPGQRSRWAYNKVRCHPVFVMDGAPTLHILLSCSDGRAAFVLNK